MTCPPISVNYSNMQYKPQNAIYHKTLADIATTFLNASQCNAGFARGYDTVRPAPALAGPQKRGDKCLQMRRTSDS